jgi:hypothetical protein
MRPSLPVWVLIFVSWAALAPTVPAAAQQYFNCEYSPRCEAIQNKQCAPTRNLKDKLSLVRSHNSAEEVEQTWALLAGFEAEYCSRLGDRGSLVRDFLSYKTRLYPKLHGAACSDPQVCTESFVKSTRDRWEREELDAKIKAELEKRSQAGVKAGNPPATKPAAPPSAAPGSWETTIQVATPATPAKTRTRTVQSR